MAINDNQFKTFNDATIKAYALDYGGVYALFDSSGAVTYYGRAMGGTTTIKSRLLDHLSGREGRCTAGATYWKQEYTTAPASRERELLQEYFNAYGRLPACNEVMP